MSVVAGIDLAWHDGFLLQLQLAELSDEQLDGKDMRAVLREFVGANEASRLIERARALRGFIDHRIARALDARAGLRRGVQPLEGAATDERVHVVIDGKLGDLVAPVLNAVMLGVGHRLGKLTAEARDARPCPKCGAAIGAWCTSDTPNVKMIHRERFSE